MEKADLSGGRDVRLGRERLRRYVPVRLWLRLRLPEVSGHRTRRRSQYRLLRGRMIGLGGVEGKVGELRVVRLRSPLRCLRGLRLRLRLLNLWRILRLYLPRAGDDSLGTFHGLHCGA